jgi:RTX calcium-binding nonapeptide repeat (4 copies)
MATFTVANLADSGTGSLRQALADAETAAGADTITFANGLAGGTIRLASRLVIASGEVDIDGDLDNDGDADITLSGDSNNNGVADASDTSLLRVAAGADVGIGGLVLADGFGRGADGITSSIDGTNAAGAIENLGVLAIANSVLRDNTAEGGAGYGFSFSFYSGGNGGDAAGAILNAGSLTVTNTEFASNRAGGGDGGVGSNGMSGFGGPALDGYPGGDGGLAAAAILNLASGELVLNNVALRDGAAEGGSGGTGGDGMLYPLGGAGDGGDGGDGGAASAGIVNYGNASGDARAYVGSSLGGPGGAGGIGATPFGDPYSFSFNGANGIPGATDGALVNSGGGLVTITIFGTQSVDVFTGTAAVDRYNGFGGDDAIAGLAADDILAGGAGKDSIDGGTGADTMTGGLGNDTYYVDAAGDQVIEALNQGYDTINTSLLAYTLGANLERANFTGAGNFVGRGNALANRLQGAAGNDKFIADAGGADIYSGGTGSDSMDFRSSAAGAVLNFIAKVHGGAALGDTFSSVEKYFGSNAGGDTMTAGTGVSNFSGFGGDDTLTGNISIDRLSGGDGDDAIDGGANGDTIQGGKGNDILAGGSGADLFLYVETAASGGWGADTVTDWEDGIDLIKVHTPAASSIADFTIAGNGTASVLLTLNALPSSTITLNGAAAITITAADFLFY